MNKRLASGNITKEETAVAMDKEASVAMPKEETAATVAKEEAVAKEAPKQATVTKEPTVAKEVAGLGALREHSLSFVMAETPIIPEDNLRTVTITDANDHKEVCAWCVVMTCC